MKDLSKVKYFEPVEKIANILLAKTQSSDPLFFRILVSYYLAKVASMMRCDIKTLDRGNIPVSMYAINLATSGYGKGHSTNIMEEEVINKFRESFLTTTFPEVSEKNLAKIATVRSVRDGTEPEIELKKVADEFERIGALLFSFDSATTPAVKQMRHKLLMASAGSVNMEIDEIGSNLLGQQEVLTTFLELYDVGKVKPKLIKNTKDSERSEDIDGRTPTNMMLFGTPNKLLNGGKEEDEFNSMLDTGYARRCIFGYSRNGIQNFKQTAQELYDILTDTTASQYIHKVSNYMAKLADRNNFGRFLEIDKAVTLELLEYKIECEYIARQMPPHKEIDQAEMSHRYFKALKLAGAYAFYDGSNNIESHHLWSAIKLVEDSGEAFAKIMTQDKAHVKLAKYIASVGHEVTLADLVEDLPFYGGSEANRKGLMEYAIGWGYKNNVIIKKTYADGIEFLSGESLAKTDLNKLTISYSQDQAYHYKNAIVPWNKIHTLTQNAGYHFINHALISTIVDANGASLGYNRNEENCAPGFNLVIIDVDSGIDIATAELLLQDYTYLLYETKRSTPKDNRFRVIFPISHEIKLDAKDYKEYMLNFYDSLPFDVDRVTNQRARKWLSHNGYYKYHSGEVIDGLLFIPKTAKAERREKQISELKNLNAIERWFAMNTTKGNRSNLLIRYALTLVDSGMTSDEVKDKVLSFNKKLDDSLDEAEIFSTILVTANKAIIKKNTK